MNALLCTDYSLFLPKEPGNESDFVDEQIGIVRIVSMQSFADPDGQIQHMSREGSEEQPCNVKPVPLSKLGDSLLEARRRIETSGAELLSLDQVRAEARERRGRAD